LANGLTRLVTLTYRPPQPTDPRVVLRDVQAFQRRLSEAFPRVVWARVFERHKSGALHVHLIASTGLPSDAVERRTRRLARLWGHGFVDVGGRFGRPGDSGRERARAAARYAAKYVAKGLEEAQLGQHSYEVRQGFQPVAVKVRAWTAGELRLGLIGEAGGEVPVYEWDSAALADWRGPPVAWLSWEARPGPRATAGGRAAVNPTARSDTRLTAVRPSATS
jgi:hypothetical protein